MRITRMLSLGNVRQQAKEIAGQSGLMATVVFGRCSPRDEYGPCGKEQAEYFVPVYRIRFLRSRRELGVVWIPADEIRPLGRLLKLHLSLRGIKP